ncbi:MAG: hypothetical protein EPN75_14365 [Beijerinckiaceae bacterium]|nr:MAG: hypothetical protein EPN75_14365 [Beijerinckiaceae bacterium]
MRYLGSLSGNGVIMRDGEDVGRAAYDFDGFLQPKIGITSSGEIRIEAVILQSVFGRNDIQLRTDDGRLFALRFSEKKLLAAAESAHVEVTGELPVQQDWHH